MIRCRARLVSSRHATRKHSKPIILKREKILIRPYRIGLFYNAIPFQYWKDEVEQWAKEKYPEQWAQLEKLERTEYEEGPKFEGISNEFLV